MQKRGKTTTKVHYKMYKDGKHWVVAGIATALLGGGLWVLQPNNVKAATSPEVTASTTSTATVNKETNDTAKTVTQLAKQVSSQNQSETGAKQMATSEATSDKSEVASGNDTNKTAAIVKQNDSPTDDRQSESIDGTNSNNNTATSTLDDQTVSNSARKDTPEDDAKTATGTKQPAGSDILATKTPSNATAVHKSETKSKTTPKANTLSGTDGTVAWNIDDDSILHFGAGIFSNNSDQHRNWQSQDNITQISFDGKVVLHVDSHHGCLLI